jgi:hypothetical protein
MLCKNKHNGLLLIFFIVKLFKWQTSFIYLSHHIKLNWNPYLSSSETTGSAIIKRQYDLSRAFQTHSYCYSTPPKGFPSFCDQPFSVWLHISWIFKQSLFCETSETVKQILQILLLLVCLESNYIFPIFKIIQFVYRFITLVSDSCYIVYYSFFFWCHFKEFVRK